MTTADEAYKKAKAPALEAYEKTRAAENEAIQNILIFQSKNRVSGKEKQ